MKKVITWILLLSMLMLAGCGGDPTPTDTQPSTQESTEATTEGTMAGVDFSSYENTVRVLCYNIYYKDVDRRSENIQDLILKNDPDVLMLQDDRWCPAPDEATRRRERILRLQAQLRRRKSVT